MEYLQEQIKERVEKRVLMAYIAGASTVAGGLGAGLMKILGG
jgi:hypothetical protein